MATEIKGKVIKILQEQSGTSQKTQNEWKKGGFVIETESNFPKKVCFTAWGDALAQVNNLQTGQVIKVSFDPESREFNDKWYTDLKVWKIEQAGSGGDSTPSGYTPSAKPETVTDQASGDAGESSDDLPF